MKNVLEKIINNTLSKIAFILMLGFSFCINIIPQDLLGMVVALFISMFLTLFILINRKLKNVISSKTILLSAGVCIILFVTFINRWTNSERISSIANILHISKNILVIFVGLVLFLITFIYFLSFFSIFENKVMIENTKANEKIGKNLKISIVIYCFIISLVLITICSKSSFLYPINDWVDANCYFTVGKSILSGKVIYRDLFEQKGPWLYFLHTIASLISYDSFIGVYLIEIVACFFYLYYSYEIFALYNKKAGLILTPILGVLTYTSKAFCHGDSAEELCLPLIVYAMYISICAIKYDRFFSKKESIIIGITSGCVLWIKYTLLGCYVGLIIIPLLSWLKKDLKKTYLVLLQIIIGIIISTIPVLAYFGVNNAISDLLQVYFYDNLFGYTSDVSNTFIGKLIYGFGKGYRNIKTFNDINSVICLIGLIWMLYIKGREMMHIVLMLLFSFIFIYAGGKGLAYYSLILCPFIIWGLLFIYQFMNIDRILENKMVFNIVIFGLLFFTFFANQNRYLMFEKKENMPQYKFAEIIRKDENTTLLNYGFLDGGFYTASGIIPNCKSFCLTNYPSSELFDLQNNYCEKGLIDYVVTRDQEIHYSNYELLSRCNYYYEKEIHEYYLYGLKQ